MEALAPEERRVCKSAAYESERSGTTLRNHRIYVHDAMYICQ